MKPSNTTKYIFGTIAFILGITFFLVSILFMQGYRSHENLAIFSAIILILAYGFTLYKSFIFLNKNRVGLAYFLSIGGFLILIFLQMINCANATPFMH